MNARRDKRRRDWPLRLYEPRPGYYVWRHPNGKAYALGKVPFAHARAEAIAANAHLASQAPSLVERISGAGNTMTDLIAKMATPEKANTAKSLRSLDKQIAAKFTEPVSTITVRQVAEWIEEVQQTKARTAQALRSRLVALFGRAIALGWMESNPAAVTQAPKVRTQRPRLTLEQFRAIYERAPEAAEWLQHAMRLAIVTGADRSSIAALTRADVSDVLLVSRPKTGQRIAIPLTLRLDALGWTLADVVAHKTGVVSRYLVHHIDPHGNAPAGSPVFLDTISKAFARARDLAGVEGVTFHEIRSLCARLYAEQGNVDVQALLGHKSAEMTAVYRDPRGVEAVRVRVGN